MFKGLRTKIESEQKGQSSKQIQKPGFGRGGGQSNNKTQFPTDSSTNVANQPNTSNDSGTERDTSTATNILAATNPAPSSRQLDPIIDKDDALTRENPPNISKQLEGNTNAKSDEERTFNDLDDIVRLRDRLRTVIRERDEYISQRDESYQIIEALKKDLELHKAKNTNLETKLNDHGSVANKTDDAKSNGEDNSKLGKPFNPMSHIASDTSISDNVEVLRHEIIELQAQLAKKNRQLKIRQQNLTDMKKALQKEILEHGKTQEELAKLQKQLNNKEPAEAKCDSREATIPTTKQTVIESNSNEPGGNANRNSQHGNDNNNHGDSGHRSLSMHVRDVAEDTISLNAAIGSATVQFDRLSCLSRSSASVDDFESNDLQHSNNINKEVSHEYLKNVLFRYMTSTDTETTQHLVKAISVLMDFTPEQSAAIKSSTNGRISSWLRMK